MRTLARAETRRGMTRARPSRSTPNQQCGRTYRASASKTKSSTESSIALKCERLQMALADKWAVLCPLRRGRSGGVECPRNDLPEVLRVGLFTGWLCLCGNVAMSWSCRLHSPQNPGIPMQSPSETDAHRALSSAKVADGGVPLFECQRGFKIVKWKVWTSWMSV